MTPFPNSLHWLHYRILALPIVALLFSASGSQAESLARAVEAAWQRYPQVSQLAAQLPVLEAHRNAASGLFPPAPYIQSQIQNDSILSNQGYTTYAIEAGTPVWRPREGRATARVAQAGLHALDAQSGELRPTVAGLVRDAAGAVEEAQLAGPPAQRRTAAARQLAGLVERSALSGESSTADALLARSEAVTAELVLRDQRMLLAQAKSRFAALTGLQEAPSLAQDRTPPPIAPPGHPRLLAAQRAVETAAAALRLVEISDRDSPIIAITGTRERQLYQERFDNRIGLTLRIPLATESRNRPRITAAQLDLNRAQAALAMAEREVGVAQEQARIGWQTARLRSQSTEENYRLLDHRRAQLDQAYLTGETPLIEVIRGRIAAFEADLGRARAHAAENRARSQLDQALGVLP